ncbi:MAG: hypothetical protein M3Y85_09270 [Bacteroidota bacterium]|nr:hypothetical protein [Bacteroidota bacterium]
MPFLIVDVVMNKFLKLLLLLFPFISNAQANYEIQVYGSQTQQPHSTIFELHSNFTFKGEKELIKGVRPSYHALHETVEITHGISQNFEIGFYLFTNYTANYGYNLVGTHIRPRVMAPLSWHWPVGVSLSAEIGYQRPQYAGETWSLELRPIVDKQWNAFYLSFNPTLGIAIRSPDNNHVPVFEPNLKAAYNAFRNFSIGLEYYGEMGTIDAFETLAAQNHAVFLSADMLNNPTWELNTGAGFGLTPATDGFIFKVLIGRRIFWKQKQKN